MAVVHHLRKSLAYISEPFDELRGLSELVNEANLVANLRSDKFGRLLRIAKSRLDSQIALKIRFEENYRKLKIKGEEIEVEESLDESLRRLRRL